MHVQSKPKGLRTRRADGVHSSLRAGDQWPHSKPGRECILPFFAFCSIQASEGLDEAHPHRGGPSALLSLQIQMLISSRNTLPDTPRIMAAPCPSQVDTKKCNHHRTGDSSGTKAKSRGPDEGTTSFC